MIGTPPDYSSSDKSLTHFYAFSKLSSFVTSYTIIAASAFLKYNFVSASNFSCPAVSQRFNFILPVDPSSSVNYTYLVLNPAPRVGILLSSNLLNTNLNKIEVFPTLESPMIKTFLEPGAAA